MLVVGLVRPGYKIGGATLLFETISFVVTLGVNFLGTAKKRKCHHYSIINIFAIRRGATALFCF